MMKGIRRQVVAVEQTRLDRNGDHMFTLVCGHSKRIHTAKYVHDLSDMESPKFAICNDCKPCKHQFVCDCKGPEDKQI